MPHAAICATAPATARNLCARCALLAAALRGFCIPAVVTCKPDVLPACLVLYTLAPHCPAACTPCAPFRWRLHAYYFLHWYFYVRNLRAIYAIFYRLAAIPAYPGDFTARSFWAAPFPHIAQDDYYYATSRYAISCYFCKTSFLAGSGAHMPLRTRVCAYGATFCLHSPRLARAFLRVLFAHAYAYSARASSPLRAIIAAPLR